MSFFSYLINMSQSLRGMQIPLEPKNCGQYLVKTTIKHENDKFMLITLKHVSGLKVDVNRPGTIKLWAITHENDHKTRKRQAFGHNSQTCIRS